MKTITIRDLRQRWPEAERMLQVENELIITRDGTPVAKLTRYVDKKNDMRKRWDPVEHFHWLKKFHGNKVVNWVDEGLAKDRAERDFSSGQS